MSYLEWTAALEIKVGEVIAKRDTKPDSQPFHHPLFLDRLACENGEGDLMSRYGLKLRKFNPQYYNN